MDQLVVLQEIYESLFRGEDALESIDSESIEGSCPQLVARLLEGSKKGQIEEAVCLKLADCLDDIFEIKRLGDICRKAGLFGLSIMSYNKALSLCDDGSVRPVLFNNLGQAYARQGDIARAVIYYQKAADGFKRAGDSQGLGHVLGNLGSAYRLDGNWDKAIESSYSGLKIFEEARDAPGVARMTGSLGRVYSEMGELDLAEKYFERSLKDFQRLGDKKSAAWVLDRMGRVAHEKKDWEMALSCFRQSLDLLEEMGCSQSSGVVLCSLGRMQLEMGEPAEARDSLESAVKLVPESVQPAHQNVLSALAATYSALARACLEKSDAFRPAAGKGDQKAEALASEYYSLASERYLELAQTLKIDHPEIRVAAEITKGRSALAGLNGHLSDAEALAQVEKAALALESAAQSATGPRRVKIEGLQRTLAGMREAWSVGLMEREPWKLMKAVSNAAEFLRGGCSGSNEAEGLICRALQSMSASIEAERARKDPQERLEEAAPHLRSAEKRSLAEGTGEGRRNAQKIGEAAGIIEGLAGLDRLPAGPEAAPSVTDRLWYRPQKEALLLVARVLMNSALSEIDDTAASFMWNESLKPTKSHAKSVSAPEPGRRSPAGPKGPVGDHEAGLFSKDALPVLELSRPRGLDEGASGDVLMDAEALDITEEDGVEIDAVDCLVSDAIYPSGNCLDPDKASIDRSSSAQILLKPERALARTFEVVEPVLQEAPASVIMSYEGADAKASRSGFAGTVAGGRLHGPPPSSRKIEDGVGLFSRGNTLKLVKALTVVVFLLLAIETILYLI